MINPLALLMANGGEVPFSKAPQDFSPVKQPKKQNPMLGFKVDNSAIEYQKREINRLFEQRNSVQQQIIDNMLKTSSAKMQMPQQEQVDPQQQLMAAIGALVAQGLGARAQYAQQGLQNFQQGSQGIVDARNQQNMQNAALDFENQQRAMQGQGQALGMELSGIESQIKSGQNILGEEYDAMRNAQNNERMLQQSREKDAAANYRAELKTQFDYFKAQLTDDTKRYLNENPQKTFELRQMYDQAIEYGYSPAEAAQLVFSDELQSLASAKLSESKANKVDKLLPGKVEQQAARTEQIYNDIRVKNRKLTLDENKIKLKNEETALTAQELVLLGGVVTQDTVSDLSRLGYEVADRIKSAKSEVDEIKKKMKAGNMNVMEVMALTAKMAELQRQIPVLMQTKEENHELLIKAKDMLKKQPQDGYEPWTPKPGSVVGTSGATIGGAIGKK